ncbi:MULTISPECIES: hypothetical protein [unclassified Tatumella]|nr:MULTISPECIES: hypothetical protein [unclassified Tatumella]MBS0857618.1 hypothetical protein [Tatumella sp. JGM16]MBS0914319.1 hypothetical protein [Tatumella sp. JGM91]
MAAGDSRYQRLIINAQDGNMTKVNLIFTALLFITTSGNFSVDVSE